MAKIKSKLGKEDSSNTFFRPGFIYDSWFSCVHVCRCALDKLGSWWWCHGSPSGARFGEDLQDQAACTRSPKKGLSELEKHPKIRWQIEQNIWDTFQQTQTNIDMENAPCVDHVLRKKTHMDFHRHSEPLLAGDRLDNKRQTMPFHAFQSKNQNPKFQNVET